VAAGFQQTGERTVHQGHAIRTVVGTFVGPDGAPFERDIVRHPGAVSIVPLHDDATVSLVRQYRAAIDADMLEIPAGIRDVDGELPEITASREMAEEVGLVADRIELLADYYGSAGYSDARTWVFLGTGLHACATDLQGIEEQHMTIERIRLDDVQRMISEREIVDGKTIIGLLLTILRFR
jgi:ADP-ribose pyrophosphatase